MARDSTSEYTDEDRRRAVIEYCVLGNMRRVAERIGIPDTTLATWKNHSDWWPVMQAEVLDQVQEEILANNLTVATKSQQALLDRIENGDVENKVLKGDGGVSEVVTIRTPVKARDLAIIGSIAQDKARVQLGKPTRISDTSNAMADLAEQFRELARQNQEKVVSEQ